MFLTEKVFMNVNQSCWIGFQLVVKTRRVLVLYGLGKIIKNQASLGLNH